ncbi:MAG: SufS family cysteine desulfurase [Candidatus Sungbacteria bacterium]|nr:SufS family cysteine desulfurase [Candidatus Sungbacteria bacterium]
MQQSSYKTDFPIFEHWEKQGKPLVYLDSAAMCQMPQQVIDAVRQYDEHLHANVHRGIYALSEQAGEQYERAREIVRSFLNARSGREIIFTRNTTESINLVAYALGKSMLAEGDHILISRAEHHSNILPWQMLTREKGIVLDSVDQDENGMISLNAIECAITSRTRLAAFSHISHVLGTINSVADMGNLFRKHNILFLVDAAQSAGHLPIDVQKIGCDFLVFSGHKMGGPTGIGVLYGREELMQEMPPFMRGGGMIREVSIDQAEWAELPAKFEAGTPNVGGAVGLAAAIAYLQKIGFGEIQRIDRDLTQETFARMKIIPGLHIFGPVDPQQRGGVVSFAIDGVHPHDLATLLDRDGICVRAGHHCAMPLMQYLGVSATARASFWVYNTKGDIERLAEGVKKAINLLVTKSPA